MNNFLQEKLSDYAYFLLMFFLPLSLLMGNIFLAILFLSILVKKRQKGLDKTVIIALGVFFTFTLVNGLIATSYSIEQSSYIKILPILLLPFCIATLDKSTRINGFLFLFFGILIIQVNSIIGIVDYYYFTEGKKYALKNYSKVNEILKYERPYLGYFSVLNIIISYLFFKRHKKTKLAIIIALFSITLIILISARLSIISTIIIGLMIVFVELNKTKRIIALSGIVVLLLTFFSTNSSLKQRFLKINNDARVVIWKGAINTFIETDKMIFGSGSQVKTRSKLLEHYKKSENFDSLDEKKRFITKNYNTHNQYLNELLRGGFLGLLIFLLPQVLILYSNLKNQENIFGVLLVVSILCFCLVENILDRQIGVYLYAIILSLYNVSEKEFKKHD